jgi:coenzyme F420-0:L-glutamate ligase/coenzyme F420-1:gamma-L-glutamate ligase
VTEAGSLSLIPIRGLPEVQPEDDLSVLLDQALKSSADVKLCDGDVLVVTQKIVSKAENRYVNLASIEPGIPARDLAQQCRKDPRIVELVLRESREVLRVAPQSVIVRHRLGWVMANAGIDQSNLPKGDERVLLLPEDPDASAVRLRRQLQQRYGLKLAVLISDSFGRPWRLGSVGVCIGCAGLRPLQDLRGTPDLHQRSLQNTLVALADQLCAAAAIISGEAAQAVPMVLVRGLSADCFGEGHTARELQRPYEQDLFR